MHRVYYLAALSHWNEFLNQIKRKRVGEITPQDVIYYGLYVERKGKDKSPTWIRARFQAIRTIFNYAMKKHIDIENVKNVVAYLKGLDVPKKNGVNPQEISKDDFHTLLKHADTKWKAILLLSLNCGFYPVDVCHVRLSHIDLDKKTLRNTRTKTGVPRIAVLWNRTIQALKAYLKIRPMDSDIIFVTNRGANQPAGISKGFKILKEKAGLKDVQFSHIRDSAQTAAIQGNADPVHVDMLLGHKTGIRDNYLLRKPEMVTDACQAIERHYFS